MAQRQSEGLWQSSKGEPTIAHVLRIWLTLFGKQMYSQILSHENLVHVHEVDIDRKQGVTRILMEVSAMKPPELYSSVLTCVSLFRNAKEAISDLSCGCTNSMIPSFPSTRRGAISSKSPRRCSTSIHPNDPPTDSKARWDTETSSLRTVSLNAIFNSSALCTYSHVPGSVAGQGARRLEDRRFRNDDEVRQRHQEHRTGRSE
jgi:hypothetical protein